MSPQTFLDAEQRRVSVSPSNPLPVTAVTGAGVPVTATMDDLLAELQAQTALLTTIATNTAPP